MLSATNAIKRKINMKREKVVQKKTSQTFKCVKDDQKNEKMPGKVSKM